MVSCKKENIKEANLVTVRAYGLSNGVRRPNPLTPQTAASLELAYCAASPDQQRGAAHCRTVPQLASAARKYMPAEPTI